MPTEAEWEYAARAGTETAYWWGPEIGKNNANCHGCGSKWDLGQAAPVGSFQPNPWGLYDTAENVWEWVQDCWHDSYEGAPNDGSAWAPKNPADCELQVLRGGSVASEPQDVRSGVRWHMSAADEQFNVGFRLARSL